MVQICFLFSSFFRGEFILLLQLTIEMITGFYILWFKGNFQHSIAILDKLVERWVIHYLFQWPSCSSARTCCFTLLQWQTVFVLIRIETGTHLNKYCSWMYKRTLAEWALLWCRPDIIILNPNLYFRIIESD